MWGVGGESGWGRGQTREWQSRDWQLDPVSDRLHSRALLVGFCMRSLNNRFLLCRPVGSKFTGELQEERIKIS